MVAFDFNNPTGSDVQFDSLITGAGLGFYLAKVNDGCKYSSCTEVTGSGASLSLLKPSNPFFADDDGISILGLAGFDFSIFDGKTELYRVTGNLALKYSDVDGVFVDPLGFTPTGGVLNNFGRTTPFGDKAALGYAWDATPVSFLLGEGLHHLSYSTSVYSWSQAATLECGASLISFSGFGDPIGRGGGIDSLAARSSAFASATSADACVSDGRIKGVNFTPTTFDAPTFDGKTLVFGRGGAVPEPAGWALMILGFGLLGTALRRRYEAQA
jgi:hypothetical protein